MTFSPTCPEPMHRLFAIVGKDRIDQEMADGWPSLLAAVSYLLLEEHDPEQWRYAAELVIEGARKDGGSPNADAILEDPEQFWVAILGDVMGMDPFTGEYIREPVRDHHHPRRRARPHGPRPGPFRRR